MASGFFCVAGPRYLELGFESGANDRVEGVIGDVQLVALLDPLPHSLVRGEAGELPEGLLKRRQHVWREHQGLASRYIQRQQGVQATRFVECKPVANGIPMDAQQAGHVPVGLDLPASQQVEHLEPWFPATVMFTW